MRGRRDRTAGRSLDDAGVEVVLVARFLAHLADSGFSPNTLCAYGYDLRRLAEFLRRDDLEWNDFTPAKALEFLGYLRRLPSRRPAQRLGLTIATSEGRLLSGATVQRILAATSSFFEWAIAAEAYGHADNPMQKRVDAALAGVPDRHGPFVGAASRQQPIRRTVRVRLPIRLPRPMQPEDVDALLASMTTLRDLAIFLLMLDGGLRPGEVLCLRLDDVSYGRRRVTIRKRDDHPRGARAKARFERVVDLHQERTLDAAPGRYACCTSGRSSRRARSCSWSADPAPGAANR